ncbi:DUF262 domain-containing protein [Deinococcus saxicola]|uniref:GmrSD restriction endonuclease domain-containing protein n=1 Tax=Deinococcus saxicola TaxID=249406 RepID=UPI0039EFDCD2
MTTSFEPGKVVLSKMLERVGDGSVQLPDFQRGWVWSDEHIRSLLASISMSYPIGAVMLLGSGNEDVRFKLRPLEGVDLPAGAKVEELLLDGQQRLTSLFQALASNKPVMTRDTRDNEIQRWYYVDMRRATHPNMDREDAFISVPEDRRVRNFRREVIRDYSAPELEREAAMFPLNLLFQSMGLMQWAMAFIQMKPENPALWEQFSETIVKAFAQYQIPVISMGWQTPKDAVCQVFEKVNTGGVSLTVFELLTATYAADDYQLREEWFGSKVADGIEQRLKKFPVLKSIENTDFLQAVTLLATHAARQRLIDNGSAPQDASALSCKRRDILKLPLDDFKQYAPAVEKGFLKAAQLLHNQKVFTTDELPYRTQLVPLAATLAVLGHLANDLAVKDKLIQWYWCGVFGELYASATETRFAKDFPELLEWIGGGEEPGTVKEATFNAQRLDTLRTRNSAAYKGVYALLMRDGAEDFGTGQPATEIAYFDEKIDIHHIFPQDWCIKREIPRDRYNSVVNKTPLTATTNRRIGKKAPSVYLADLQGTQVTDARMDEILRTHVIDVQAMRADHFDDFYDARKASLLKRIENAMKKPVIAEE